MIIKNEILTLCTRNLLLPPFRITSLQVFTPFKSPLSYGARANSLNGAIKCLGKKEQDTFTIKRIETKAVETKAKEGEKAPLSLE